MFGFSSETLLEKILLLSHLSGYQLEADLGVGIVLISPLSSQTLSGADLCILCTHCPRFSELPCVLVMLGLEGPVSFLAHHPLQLLLNFASSSTEYPEHSWERLNKDIPLRSFLCTWSGLYITSHFFCRKKPL